MAVFLLHKTSNGYDTYIDQINFLLGYLQASFECFLFFQGFPQHSVSHSSEQPNEEEGVGEEEREQVEGLHQAELRAAHQLSKSSGSIAVVVCCLYKDRE
jgi:hypothetical protein